MTGCSVLGCTRRSENGFKLFQVPKGQSEFNRERRHQWLNRIGRSEIEHHKESQFRICALHFNPEDIYTNPSNGKHFLRADALPLKCDKVAKIFPKSFCNNNNNNNTDEKIVNIISDNINVEIENKNNNEIIQLDDENASEYQVIYLNYDEINNSNNNNNNNNKISNNNDDGDDDYNDNMNDVDINEYNYKMNVNQIKQNDQINNVSVKNCDIIGDDSVSKILSHHTIDDNKHHLNVNNDYTTINCINTIDSFHNNYKKEILPSTAMTLNEEIIADAKELASKNYYDIEVVKKSTNDIDSKYRILQIIPNAKFIDYVDDGKNNTTTTIGNNTVANKSTNKTPLLSPSTKLSTDSTQLRNDDDNNNNNNNNNNNLNDISDNTMEKNNLKRMSLEERVKKLEKYCQWNYLKMRAMEGEIKYLRRHLKLQRKS